MASDERPEMAELWRYAHDPDLLESGVAGGHTTGSPA